MREKLIKTALVGTKHHTSHVSEQDLLQQFGVLAFQQLAGYVPAKSDLPVPEAAPVLETVCCTNETFDQFLRLKRIGTAKLLFQWVEKFHEAKLHIPNEHLPILLGRRNRFSYFNRDTYAPLMSDTAAWLIRYAQNEEWEWFFDYQENDTIMGVNLRENPVLWFEKTRIIKPAVARKWFAENWQDVNYLYQAGMIHAFRHGLSEDDIPVLESLLDVSDHKHILALHYDVLLLLSILEAKRVQTQIDNIFEMLYLEQKGGTLVIDFCWSDVFENPPKNLKFRSWAQVAQQCDASTLSDFIRLVPLKRWYKRWYIGFLGMVKAAFNGNHGSVIALGWLKRVIDEKDEDIAVDLLSHSGALGDVDLNEYRSQLVQVLSFERFQSLIDEWLNYA